MAQRVIKRTGEAKVTMSRRTRTQYAQYLKNFFGPDILKNLSGAV